MRSYASQKIGVDIVQPIVPHYRVPFFEGLAQQSDLDLSIQCAAECPSGDRSVSLNVPSYYPDRAIHKIGEPGLLWQKKLRLVKVRKPGDVLVVCGDLHFVSNWPLIWKAKRMGAGVVWWGHHWSASTKKWLYPFRLLATRMAADRVLLYTRTGKDLYIKHGFPSEHVFYTGNTIDITRIDQALARMTPIALHEFKQRHGIGGNTLLFCGVLREKTRLELLIEALAQIRDTNVQLVVIGEGPLKNRYQELALKRGVDDNIRWVGEIRSESDLVWWFCSARAFIYPGSIGLSLMHAFAYGLPVVTHDNEKKHFPEIEALREGENGWTYEEGSVASLVRVLRELLADQERCEEMGRRAYHVLREEYSMNQMIERFADCVRDCSRFALSRHG